MRKKWIVASCLAALTLAGGLVGGSIAACAAEAPAALALGETPGPLRLLISGQIGRLLTLRADLNLSADQKQQIKQILQSRRTDIATALRPVVEKRRDLREAVLADKPDEKAIRAAADNLATAIGDAAVEASKVRGEVANVLTPDQRATMAAFRKDSDQRVDHFLDNLSKPE